MPIFVARDVDVESTATEFMLPVMDGVDAIHFCNTSAEKAAHNYAPGKPNATIKGVPVANANYIRFKGNVNYLETRTQESAAQTVYCVSRAIGDLSGSDTQSMAVSTFTRPAVVGGGSTFGVSLLYTNPGSGPIMQAIGSRGTLVANHITGSVGLAIPAPGDWRLGAALIKDAVTKNEVYNLTTGEKAISSAANTARLPTSGFFRIGSSYATSSYLGEIDIACVVIASIAHTEAQMKLNAEAIRAYLAPRGITI